MRAASLQHLLGAHGIALKSKAQALWLEFHAKRH